MARTKSGQKSSISPISSDVAETELPPGARRATLISSPVISSRYNDPRELSAMERALAMLRPEDRRWVVSVWANSKNGWITVTLAASADQRVVARVGAAFHRGLAVVTGVYAMVSVRAGGEEEQFDGGGDPEDGCTCGCLGTVRRLLDRHFAGGCQ